MDSFKWVENTSKFSNDFIKTYNENSNEGHFLDVDIQCPEKLYNLHNDLLFLPERMKIERVETLLANFYNKKEYANQALA